MKCAQGCMGVHGADSASTIEHACTPLSVAKTDVHSQRAHGGHMETQPPMCDSGDVCV
jgi:hypothetical protein